MRSFSFSKHFPPLSFPFDDSITFFIVHVSVCIVNMYYEEENLKVIYILDHCLFIKANTGKKRLKPTFFSLKSIS
jgi:hypothetical protein